MEKAFEEAYKKLNTAQKQAVDTIDGPVMVIAGPGTGKTQILALRIANILLKTDTKPENILALTFTDAGRHTMRKRLRSFIGEASYKVAIHTFHSFAGELIKNYPDSYPAIIGGRPATDIERFSIIEDIIEGGEVKELRPSGDPLYYVKKIPSAIADLKKEYITPDELNKRITDLESSLDTIPKLHEKGAHKGKVRSEYLKEEKRIKKLKEFALVYRQYQEILRERKLYDFEDMIVETVGAMEKNVDMLLDLQETYQYILADEHQDVNEAQNKILDLLANFHQKPNIFVVGDEKQSIYRFQGASLLNFLYFENRFPGTEVIDLRENYRSNQNILDLAHELIKSEGEDLKKLRVPLKSSNEKVGKGKQEQRLFSHEAVEDDWLVNEVKTLIESGSPKEEIAVIVRYNRDVEHFSSLLRSSGIEVSASAESDILDHPLTLVAENLMLATLEPHNESAFFAVLTHSCFGIEGGDLALILSNRSYGNPLRKIAGDKKTLEEIGVKNVEKILSVTKILADAKNLSVTKAPHFVLSHLLKESGLLSFVTEHDSSEGSRVLRRLYDDIEAMVVENQATSLNSVVSQLKYRRSHSLPLVAPYINADHTAVQVMTAHKSKGLEFETVFLPRATDSAFGKSTTRDYFKLPVLKGESIEEENEDDKRLFYVAMTRAKENLFISSSTNTINDKVQEPSRFLLDLPDKLLEKVDTKNDEEEFIPESIMSGGVYTLKLKPEDIKQLFLLRGFAVTHLNNYLEDPQKYYLENLLRQPKPQTLPAMKGNAVHEILDMSVAGFRKSESWPSMSEVNQRLKTVLERMPIGEHDFARLHEESLNIVNAYLPVLTSLTNKLSRPEMSFRVTLETKDPELPEIMLTGKIDRLDFDAEGKVIRVTDYKTGKAKSRNEIEGKTKSSNGNYKRQLVFYALLLELYGFEQKSPEFVLSFVEPREKSGEIVECSFDITKEEIEELKVEIIRVSKEIISGEKFI